MLDQTEMRKHPGSPRSIAAYLTSKNLTLEDRELIAEISQPKGWNQRFVDFHDLTAEELEARGKVLDAIKKYPAIKVSQQRFALRLKPRFSNHITYAQEQFLTH